MNIPVLQKPKTFWTLESRGRRPDDALFWIKWRFPLYRREPFFSLHSLRIPRFTRFWHSVWKSLKKSHFAFLRSLSNILIFASKKNKSFKNETILVIFKHRVLLFERRGEKRGAPTTIKKTKALSYFCAKGGIAFLIFYYVWRDWRKRL